MNFYLKKPSGLLQHRQNFAWQRLLQKVAVLVALLIFLNIFNQQIRNAFLSISSPLSGVFLRSGSSTSDFLHSFISFQYLKNENNSLLKENEKLLGQIALLNDALRRQDALEKAVSNTREDNFNIQLAGVIGLDSANDTIFIDKGSSDGIAAGMPVISQEKVLYGRVAEVYRNYSQVMLISSAGSALNVKINQADALEKPVQGVLKGQGGLAALLDLVNIDASVNASDVLVTSGLEGMFPPNLLAGKIVSVQKNDAKAFQTASVQPFFDVKNIGVVFAITDYKR